MLRARNCNKANRVFILGPDRLRAERILFFRVVVVLSVFVALLSNCALFTLYVFHFVSIVLYLFFSRCPAYICRLQARLYHTRVLYSIFSFSITFCLLAIFHIKITLLATRIPLNCLRNIFLHDKFRSSELFSDILDIFSLQFFYFCCCVGVVYCSFVSFNLQGRKKLFFSLPLPII